MLIFDDKYFVEVEAFIRLNSGNLLDFDLMEHIFQRRENYTIYDGTDYYMNVDSVDDFLKLVFDWSLNKNEFEHDTVDILDKRYFYLFRSYKTIERIKKGVFDEG